MYVSIAHLFVNVTVEIVVVAGFVLLGLFAVAVLFGRRRGSVP